MGKELRLNPSGARMSSHRRSSHLETISRSTCIAASICAECSPIASRRRWGEIISEETRSVPRRGKAAISVDPLWKDNPNLGEFDPQIRAHLRREIGCRVSRTLPKLFPGNSCWREVTPASEVRIKESTKGWRAGEGGGESCARRRDHRVRFFLFFLLFRKANAAL